ncbi:hypothetical protein HYH02_005874 [Chlamydomonas schloesseri]|uniref:indole-3-pyruvate monooxygenase n=1 Tax=Chlamydomonas schloesseri TaxID=2026947 RepID=A0A835WKK2_9CHLO|nr:hypothetical protein HYH02_005874 [Chlamydomonas schloesseri]|eukprot:KAG2449126.1 hypothetical protein HYH02_005874 [Chlamydomonas schloesseri]
MPTAVVVGSDPAALHCAAILHQHGFDVTVLESSNAVGGQWTQALYTQGSLDPAYNAWRDGLFLDFPLAAPRLQSQGSARDGLGAGSASFGGGGGADDHPGNPNGYSTSGARDDGGGDLPTSLSGGGGGGNGAWGRTVSRSGSSARKALGQSEASGPPPAPAHELQLLHHMLVYSHAAGIHANIKLNCTLRRAKWTAMNACWRLELKNEQSMQRGQLSADLLLVSKFAVAAPRLPRVQGRELYCGTILTANDQLLEEGGAIVLEQQLRGRHVLVVGSGPAAEDWAEHCRRHAGATGAVVLLEVQDDEADNGLSPGLDDGGEGRGGLLSRLFGSCCGAGGSGPDSPCRGDSKLGRFSPARFPAHMHNTASATAAATAAAAAAAATAAATNGSTAGPATHRSEAGMPHRDSSAGIFSSDANALASGPGSAVATMAPPCNGGAGGDTNSPGPGSGRGGVVGAGGLALLGRGGLRVQVGPELLAAHGSVDSNAGGEEESGVVLDPGLWQMGGMEHLKLGMEPSEPCEAGVGGGGGGGEDGSVGGGAGRQGPGPVSGSNALDGNGVAGGGLPAAAHSPGPRPPSGTANGGQSLPRRGLRSASGAFATGPGGSSGAGAGDDNDDDVGPNGVSSLRVIKGVGALLNGTHVTFTNGDEVPADVVLLVPLGGSEPSLTFLDVGTAMRASMGGQSLSLGGGGGGDLNNLRSFKNRTVSGTGSMTGSFCSMPEGLSHELAPGLLYRDMVSNSPAAPNFALVGVSASAAAHDARAAAAQAAWLMATWAGPHGSGAAYHGDDGSFHDDGGGTDGGGGAAGRVDSDGNPVDIGFLRQATPMMANEDIALRARWRAEAARCRGSVALGAGAGGGTGGDGSEPGAGGGSASGGEGGGCGNGVYLARYLLQLLDDLGKSVRPPKGLLGSGAGTAALAAAAAQLTRGRVAKLLNTRRLRRPPHLADLTGTISLSRAASHNSRAMLETASRLALVANANAHAAASGGGGGHTLHLRPSLSPSPSSRRVSHTRGHSVNGGPGGFGSNVPLALVGSGAGDSSFSPAGDRSIGSVGPGGVMRSSAPLAAMRERGSGRMIGPGAMAALALASGAAGVAGGSSSGGGAPPGAGYESPLYRSEGSYSAFLQAPAARGSPSSFTRPSGSAASFSRTGPGSGGGGGGGPLPTSPSAVFDGALYRVAEHPSESLADAAAAAVAAMEAEAAAASYQAPPSPLSPSQSPGSSVGHSGRGRMLVGQLANIANSVAAGGGGVGSVHSSPFSTVNASGGTAAAVVAAAGGASGPMVVMDEGGGGGMNPQRRSQMLQRHRSTSRLAGVSHATTGPPMAPATSIPSSLTANSGSSGLGAATGAIANALSYGKRNPAASASQLSLEVPDRRTSYSGRASNSRRSNPAGLGGLSGGGGVGPGSLGLGGPGGPGGTSSGRLHSSTSARHQLLVAAANSASRKRNLMLAAGSPSMSPDSYSPHGGGGGGGAGAFNGPLGRHISNNGAGGGYSPSGTAAYGASSSGAHSEALNQLPYGFAGYAAGAGVGASYGAAAGGSDVSGGGSSRLRGSSNSNLAIGGAYGSGGGVGLSMSYLMAAARRGGLVSEPVGVEGVSVAVLSAPTSPARNIPQKREQPQQAEPPAASLSLGVSDPQLATFSGSVAMAGAAAAAPAPAQSFGAPAGGVGEGATGSSGTAGGAGNGYDDGGSAVSLMPTDTSSSSPRLQPPPLGASPVVGRDRRAAARRRSITLPDLRLSNSGSLRQLPTPMLHVRGGGGAVAAAGLGGGDQLDPHGGAIQGHGDEELPEYGVSQGLRQLDEDEAALEAAAHAAQFGPRGAPADDPVASGGHEQGHGQGHGHAKTHAGMTRGQVSGDGLLEEEAGVCVGMSPVRDRGPPGPSGAPSGAQEAVVAVSASHAERPGFGGADGTEAVTPL